jgi:hypothetical protein
MSVRGWILVEFDDKIAIRWQISLHTEKCWAIAQHNYRVVVFTSAVAVSSVAFTILAFHKSFSSLSRVRRKDCKSLCIS